MVLLRRDWEFLFDQLKSVHAVCGYLHRVADEPRPLGEEPLRYYDLARADAEAKPEELGPKIVAWGRTSSTPLLPLAPATTDDEQAHEMFRWVLEDVATTPIVNATETQRLQMLSELDRLPVGQRSEIGRFMIDAFEQVTKPGAADGLLWPLRRVVNATDSMHLGFGACSGYADPQIQASFSGWLQLRHHDLQEVLGHRENLTSVGVLLTPRGGRDRSWDTTVVAVIGKVGLDDDTLALLRSAWPTPEAQRNV
ncbi:MAG: hypothetical protein M3P44_04050 [Actinomycetota bacterium]|nr:hypothetical protein [Actinomycetota bacterium]MDP9344886.1 hypothetical protein [Actinomycetota bacterium]